MTIKTTNQRQDEAIYKGKSNDWIPTECVTYSYSIPNTQGKTEPRALMWNIQVYKEWFNCAKLMGKLGRKYPKEFGCLEGFETFDDWWFPPNFAADLFLEPTATKSIRELNFRKKRAGEEYLRQYFDRSAQGELKDVAFIEINLQHTQEQLKSEFASLIKKLSAPSALTPSAKFQPFNPMSSIRVKEARGEHNAQRKKDLPLKINVPRKVFEYTQEGISKVEIAYKLKFIDKNLYEWHKLAIGTTKHKTDNAIVEKLIKLAAVINGDPATKVSNALKKVSRNLKQSEITFNYIESGTFS